MAEISETRNFYHADPADYLAELKQVADSHQRVLVVGHNPGMEDLITLLTGQEKRMPTAALAQVSLPIERWQDLSDTTPGELVNLWLPRELPD